MGLFNFFKPKIKDNNENIQNEKDSQTIAMNTPPDIEKMKKSNDITGLIEALNYQGPDDDRVYHEAFKMLREIGKPALKPLIGAVQNNKYRYTTVHQHAIILLGEIGDARAVDALIPCLEIDPNVIASWLIPIDTIEALEKIGDRRAIEPIIDCLYTEDKFIIRRAATALEKMGATSAIGPLHSVLDQIDSAEDERTYLDVRYAIRTLESMGK